METKDLKNHKRGDWWNGITIPKVQRKGPLETDVFEDLDLTGVIATFQVKAKAKDETSVLDLRSDGDSPAIAITLPFGPIVIPGRTIDLPAKVYVWELELHFPTTGPKTYLGGTWEITQDVARRTY